MNTVGLAIIGSTGVIGRVHIDAIEQLDSCRLVGVNARTQPPLRQQAAELGVAAYPTLDDVLSGTNVDAIIIATPHRSHADITESAASAGKHVLVEKPMSVTPSEADRMIEACQSAGVKLGVLFNNRFRPEALKIRQLVEQGAIGEIYRVSMASAMIRSQDYYDRLDWRGKWQAEGGGALLNQGIHAIDLMQWVGGLPTSVMGIVSTRRHDIEVEDFATAAMTYKGGGQGTLHCSTSQAPNHQRLELWGNEGAIIMDNWDVSLHRLETTVNDFIEHDRSPTYDSPESATETFSFDPAGGTHAPPIDDFAKAIIEARDPAITGEDGLRSQEIVAAVTLSGCRNKRVDIPVDRAEYDSLLSELVTARRLITEN
ncbi:MAG: Gfo/Idh/MocA family oxidoreductase [Dehalococcoidia bacterium]|nr:Gfo/Idh/MocA family oxidoreductase [Dehalococcoidia bacterium]